MPSRGSPLRILYRDENIIALEKPPGMLSVPGRGPEKQDSLATRVQAEYPAAKTVHRLDMATSGVIVMALDAEAHRELGRQFEHREVSKKYIAVVHGVVALDGGEVNQPIVKDFDRPPRHKICQQYGREAISRWKVIERENELTRLAISLMTGRSHQLKMHLH